MARSMYRGCLPRGLLALAALICLPVLAPAAPPPATENDPPPALLTAKPPGARSTERAIHETQYEAYTKQLQTFYEQFLARPGSTDLLFESIRFLRTSGLALVRTSAEKVAFLEQILDLGKRIESRQYQRFKAGAINRDELEVASDFTLDAEIQFLKAKLELLEAKRKAKSSQAKADQ